TEAVYSPKRKTGRCLFHPALSGRRKDTAAYASLSFSTMSKSKTHPSRDGKEPQTPRPSRADQPEPEAPHSTSSTKNRAADEDVLSEPLRKVNSNFEIPSKFFAFPRQISSIGKLHRSQKTYSSPAFT
ncbi:hypothetical protein, partial [Microvirga arsenatis]|uniref:hypothetical protein n=1 Tax=Microvirga arsenatis TaxID=2692265 RepID=UPI001AEE43A3